MHRWFGVQATRGIEVLPEGASTAPAHAMLRLSQSNNTLCATPPQEERGAQERGELAALAGTAAVRDRILAGSGGAAGEGGGGMLCVQRRWLGEGLGSCGVAALPGVESRAGEISRVAGRHEPLRSTQFCGTTSQAPLPAQLPPVVCLAAPLAAQLPQRPPPRLTAGEQSWRAPLCCACAGASFSQPPLRRVALGRERVWRARRRPRWLLRAGRLRRRGVCWRARHRRARCPRSSMWVRVRGGGFAGVGLPGWGVGAGSIQPSAACRPGGSAASQAPHPAAEQLQAPTAHALLTASLSRPPPSPSCPHGRCFRAASSSRTTRCTRRWWRAACTAWWGRRCRRTRGWATRECTRGLGACM